jgi:hypothetical protein
LAEYKNEGRIILAESAVQLMSEPRASFFRRLLRPRLSLRVMMLAVLVVGSGLGWYVAQARRQAETVEAIKRLGGDVLYDWEFRDCEFAPGSGNPPWPDWALRRIGPDYFANVTRIGLSVPLESLDESLLARLSALRHLEWLWTTNEIPTSDASLAILGRLDQLRYLIINGDNASGDGFAHLKKLRLLEQLHAENARVDDACLANLSSLYALKELSLNAEQMTDEGLAHLGSLSNLQVLQLGAGRMGYPNLRSRITSEGLAHLAGMRRLQSLWLTRSRVSTLEPIRHLVGLRVLGLGWTKLTDDGLAPIANYLDLEYLNLDDTAITEAGLAHVANLTKLEYLSIHSVKVTKAGIAHLSRLSRLQRLTVSYDVPDEAIDSLKAKIPELVVDYY